MIYSNVNLKTLTSSKNGSHVCSCTCYAIVKRSHDA